MEVKDELMDIVEKVWHKLQSLPDANPLELGAFSVIILFFGKQENRHHLLVPTVDLQTICTINNAVHEKQVNLSDWFSAKVKSSGCVFVHHDEVKLKKK